MPRLPQVGGDDGNWGQVLNDFLTVEHNADGSLKNGYIKPSGGIPSTDLAVNAVTTAKITDQAVTNAKLSTSVQNSLTNADNAVTATVARAAMSLTTIIKSGAASVANNILPPGVRVGYATTCSGIYLRTATGSSLTVRINKNGVSWNTLSVSAGGATGSLAGVSVANPSLAAGDILTFDITAVGSTTAGSDIAVDIVGS